MHFDGWPLPVTGAPLPLSPKKNRDSGSNLCRRIVNESLSMLREWPVSYIDGLCLFLLCACFHWPFARHKHLLRLTLQQSAAPLIPQRNDTWCGGSTPLAGAFIGYLGPFRTPAKGEAMSLAHVNFP